MDTETSLVVAADLKELGAIRDFIEEVTSNFKLDSEAIADLILAVNELATNIIVHGYKGEPGIIDIRVRRQNNAIIVRLLDHAPPFDPTVLPAPDITLPLEQRPLGGMGVYLTMQLVDDISHRSLPDGGNELILVKNCAA